MPTKFDFVSPGIQLREIDQSQVTLVPEEDGLLLIGRSRKGPAMKPIKVNSLENFIEVFGAPMDGVKANDPWREGNTGAPSYAGYAAQAYLAAAVGPVKFVRLGGLEADGATGANKAGWTVPQHDYDTAGDIANVADVESAVGIFVGENTTPTGLTGMTATYTLLDKGQFQASSTITIEFAGGSYTFTTTTDATADFNINLTDITGASTNNQAADRIKTQIQVKLAAIGAAVDRTDFTASGATNNIIFTQLTLGTSAVVGAKSVTIADAGTEDQTIAFSGGTNNPTALNGVLAGVLYMSASNITLSGEGRNGVTITKQGATAIKKGTNGWTAFVSGGVKATDEITFNFDPASKDFIRNAFNTDPTEFAAGTGDNALNYFLGETFEHAVNRLDATNGLFAFTAAIISGSEGHFTDYQKPLAPAKSGWFIGQKPTQKKLFRLVALEDGSSFNKNYVVRIKDLRLATASKPNATFSVEIAGVGMKASEYVEKYSNLTLNPNDPNYIAKRIGDAHQSWSVSKSKIVTTGIYSNVSNLVRVEMSAASLNASDLPVGFVGPRTYVGPAVITEALADNDVQWIQAKNRLPQQSTMTKTITELIPDDTLTVTFPKYGLSTTGTGIRGGDYLSTALLGLSYAAQKGDENFGDLGLLREDDLFDPHLDTAAPNSDATFLFTLDEIVKTSAGKYYFDSTSGSPVALATLIDTEGVKQFVAPFFGGFDGTSVLLENSFNEVQLGAGGSAQYSIESAIDMVGDRDIIRYDLISIPGVTKRAVNQDLINQTEARGDALAIVDVAGIYQPGVDTGADKVDQLISAVVTEINTAGFDSSYAATYYPNVRLLDNLNNNGTVILMPPSVAAIGAIARSEADSQPWFAPAGFQRGGLSPLGGSGGANVLGTVEHLTKADRDDLYQVNINPIARFPATGDTVIFGQKTLQQEASALDRINVRRLMNYLKKEIGDIADTILFDQNVQATWNRFKSQAEIVLSGVKADFGVTEYKLVLDESTTTPDLQDRNILYAKVFVKPARAIEFIAVDFVITQSGVEF